MTDSPARISASQVTLILQRAAEIDARGDTLTVEELKRIAAEAGIDPAATETAIQEVMADDESAPLPMTVEEPGAASVVKEDAKGLAKGSKSPSPGWIVAAGAVGMAMGFITALPEAISIPAFGATILFVLLRALQSMKRGAQLDFQLQNSVAWFGMFIGGAATGILGDFEVFGMAFMLWIVTSVVGGLLVRFGPRDEEPEDDLPRLGP